MAKNDVRAPGGAGEERPQARPLAVFGLCGALLAGVLLGSTGIPWLVRTVEDAKAADSSVVGGLVDTENMKDADGKFVVLPYPREDAAAYVELADLDSISVEPVERAAVTEADVDANVESYLIYYGHETDRTEGTASVGDRVAVTYQAYGDDGEPMEGYSAKGAVIRLGMANEPEGFSEALDGAAIGEEATFEATFPEDWDDEAAGKTVTFKATVDCVKEVPEVTDETVAGLTEGEFGTAAAFRAYIRESLEELDEQAYRDAVYAEALEALTAGSTFKRPSQAFLEWYASVQMKYYQAAADDAGVPIEEYLSGIGLVDNPDKVANAIADSGYDALRRYALLTAVADEAGIEIDMSDMDDSTLFANRMHELLAALGLGSEDEVKEFYREENVMNDARNQKTINWLVDNVRQEAAVASEDDGTVEGG